MAGTQNKGNRELTRSPREVLRREPCHLCQAISSAPPVPGVPIPAQGFSSRTPFDVSQPTLEVKDELLPRGVLPAQTTGRCKIDEIAAVECFDLGLPGELPSGAQERVSRGSFQQRDSFQGGGGGGGRG